MGIISSTRAVRGKLSGDYRTSSLKRMKSKRLVGVAQIALDPEARAREEFPHADLDKNGSISFEEVRLLMKRLNAYISKKKLKHLFDEVDVNHDGQLNLDEFQALYVLADDRPFLLRLYKETDQLVNGHVTAQNLHDFFLRSAPDDEYSGWKVPSVEECARMIQYYIREEKKHSKDKDGKPLQEWLFEHFRRFLSDPERNHICDPTKLFSVYQDMDKPLSHYYISSSHNSYLEGTQTHGYSKPEAIRRALELGVRVIELDVWDGSAEPIVTHGHTLCSQTTFRACIETVDKYAFVASDYPVILTIENHCTRPFQAKMARILGNVLGDKIYRFQASDVDREKLFRGPDEWTTPNDLRGCVVIRDKPKKLAPKKEKRKKKLEDIAARSPQENSSSALSVEIVQEDPQQQPSKPKKGKSRVLKLFSPSQQISDNSLTTGSERTLGVSVGLNSSDKTLRGGLDISRKISELGDSDRSQRDTEMLEDEEDEDIDTFIDDKVENEGLGDQVASKFESKKRELQMTMQGSIRFAAERLGLLDDNAPAKIREWLKEPPKRDLPTNSIAQLLEIVYIKNVKLRVREDRIKRTSMRLSIGSADGLVHSHHHSKYSLSDFRSIHFQYPEWKSSSSIPEGRMMRLVKPGPRAAGIATYSRQHLLRCYPAGKRVNSDNYQPCPPWNAGIQIVALNYQTNGIPVWLNQGKFSDNGACGWVLKPKAMLEGRSCGMDTPEEESPEEEKKRYWDLLLRPEDRGDRLTITIVSAHFLPKPVGADVQRSEIIDPFVEVHIAGYEPDETVQKTKVITDNGFNPEFHDTFQFTIRKCELDLLLFVVKDKDLVGVDLIAQNCFPLKLVRPGYRVVPLRRADSTPIPDAFLFVHVKWDRGAVPVN